MAYFEELPEISHISRLTNSNRNEDRILVKNLFKRAKLRTDIESAITAFNYYLIEEGERPDTLAKKIYDNEELDWVILITNNITNIRDQWPLSNNDLNSYMLDKYGSEENISEVHHYETNEIRDSSNRLIMKGGLVVGEEFKFEYNTPVGAASTGNIYNAPTMIQGESARGAVTNFEYENRKNDEKRKIKILKREFVPVIITDLRNIMRYDKSSSQYVSRKVITTYNPRKSGV